MNKQTVSYQDQEVILEGFAAYLNKNKQPLVILCHGWKGRDEFICQKAEQIANWGYFCFAVDMYGKGVVGKNKEENAALKKPFMEDRTLLQRRILKGFSAASSFPYADANKIAVIGFGFGGVCALDLARSGADLKGAVSVYGHFDSPKGVPIKAIKAKILVLHGYNDSVSTMQELEVFQKEMEITKVDWQAHIYSNTFHAFATPGANDIASGILYNPISEKRAWDAIKNFLSEVLK